MTDIFKLLRKVTNKPEFLDAEPFKRSLKLSDDDITSLRRLGMSVSTLNREIEAQTSVNYDRYQLYFEIMRSLDHWMMGPAVELFSDVATTYSPIHNSTVWITSDSKKHEKELNDLMDRIGVEEKIFDWAYNCGGFGDLFIKPIGQPESGGVVAVEDDINPLMISRLDYKGHLIGFYDTPIAAQQTSDSSKHKRQIITPWEYVHFRLLGAKKRRELPGDPLQTRYRNTFISGTDPKQLSSNYGTSLLINGLAPYKRLRLAEDSILLARLTRGIVRYIYKLKVDGTNHEAVTSLVDLYSQQLKRARALNTRANESYFDQRPDPMSVMHDLFLPVWGEIGNLDYMKIGDPRDVDIKWIVDIEDLRKQLSAAIRVPLPLLGSFTNEASGALGADSIEKLDIRFARSSRRLQRALISGITRLCQIHLAYRGLDPDPNLFTVHMAETSSAEEESLMKSLDRAVSVMGRFIKLMKGVDKRVDTSKLFEYCNEKFMKLEDFRMEDFIDVTKPDIQAKPKEDEEKRREEIKSRKARNLDVYSFLPIRETSRNKLLDMRNFNKWNETYGEAEITVEISERKKRKK